MTDEIVNGRASADEIHGRKVYALQVRVTQLQQSIRWAKSYGSRCERALREAEGELERLKQIQQEATP